MPNLPSFSNDVFEKILVRIMEGSSIRSITNDREGGFPSRKTLYRWLASEELNQEHELRERYELAIDIKVDNAFDEIVEIADEPPEDITVVTKTGDTVEYKGYTNEGIRNRQLRIDARKWAIARQRPKKYGDQTQRVVEEQGGNVHRKTVEYGADE